MFINTAIIYTTVHIENTKKIPKDYDTGNNALHKYVYHISDEKGMSLLFSLHFLSFKMMTMMANVGTTTKRISN